MGEVDRTEIDKHEAMIRYANITIDSLQCLKDVLEARSHAAKEWLKWSGTDGISKERRRECESPIAYLDSKIQQVIY